MGGRGMQEGFHPIRILHVVERMNRGGVEIWLMHILRTINREQFHMDFLVHSVEPGEFDEEIVALGSKIVRCPHLKNPFQYANQLRRILRDKGGYHIIHSHVHHFSGWILCLASIFGVPIRIAHSHSDSTVVDAKAAYSRKLYLELMKKLIDQYATSGLGVSEKAVQALRNGNSSNLHWEVLHCGINLSPFSSLPAKDLLRKQYKIPNDGILLGHVGNLVLPKNHTFILQVAYEFFQVNPNSYLVLIGDGELSNTIKQQAKTLAIDKQIFFLGTRQEIPALLKMMDVFLFPSIFEGLGIAVIEAQASGLPVVVSQSVPREVDLVPGLLTWMSLSQSPAMWAAACMQAYTTRHNISQLDSCNIVSRTSFNILNNVQELQNIYARSRLDKQTGARS